MDDLELSTLCLSWMCDQLAMESEHLGILAPDEVHLFDIAPMLPRRRRRVTLINAGLISGPYTIPAGSFSIASDLAFPAESTRSVSLGLSAPKN